MKFSTLLKYLTPHWNTLLLVLGILILNSLVTLLIPWIAGQFSNSVLEIGENYFVSIEILLLFWAGILGLKSLLAFISQYLLGSTGEHITASLRSRLFEHMQALPISYFRDSKPGESITLLNNDAEEISSFMTDTLVQLLPMILTLIGAFVMMLLIEVKIALLAVLFMPGYFIAMKLIGRHIRPLSRLWMDSYADMISLLAENLGLMSAIKVFVREPEEARRFNKKNEHYLQISNRHIFIQSILSPAISLLAGMGLILLLWLASAELEAGQLSPAELVSLLLYALLLTQPIGSMANVYGQIQRTRGASERILSFFSEQAEPSDEGKIELDKVKGKIEFSKVTFTYPDRKIILKDLELVISAGEVIAITGENGSGKTTLIHLLMRMFEPDSGEILLDDIDLKELSISSLRRQIGLVDQHTILLNGSLAENIAYSEPLISRSEIEAAARVAHAHEFISDLPDGYDTIIGDQGLRLSGGQRQRVSLARTILKKPAILILDEATSMLDPQGEKGFIEECRNLFKQSTVIMISHQEANLALADRILKLENGVLISINE